MPNIDDFPPLQAYQQEYEEMTVARPTLVTPGLAREIERMSSRPGSVFPIPEGSLRDMGETVSIPFVDGSNARIEETGEFVWTSQDGTTTPISKLEDSHLANIIKLLSRNMIGLDEKSRQYQRNESTLILMRAERDKRNAQS